MSEFVGKVFKGASATSWGGRSGTTHRFVTRVVNGRVQYVALDGDLPGRQGSCLFSSFARWQSGAEGGGTPIPEGKWKEEWRQHIDGADLVDQSARSTVARVVGGSNFPTLLLLADLTTGMTVRDAEGTYLIVGMNSTDSDGTVEPRHLAFINLASFTDADPAGPFIAIPSKIVLGK